MILSFSNTSLGRFRMIALLEGLSFLVLLLIAMPLKYMANSPEAVFYVGWLHGMLFILYLIGLMNVWFSRKWKISRVVIALLASVIPFGTFVLDRSLKKEETN